MIKIFFALVLIPLLFTKPSEATIVWLEPVTYDFGTIAAKEVKHSFSFRNNSNQPIIIDVIRTTCGCTVPNWSEVPIFPDSVGTIDVIFDGKSKGYFRKKVMVFFHHQRKPENLWITGYVTH
jgi:hypothetical protein